eukprot:SAG11_NODE_24036_length_379_cov_0.664286_1_plen_36_part_01
MRVVEAFVLVRVLSARTACLVVSAEEPRLSGYLFGS